MDIDGNFFITVDNKKIHEMVVTLIGLSKQ